MQVFLHHARATAATRARVWVVASDVVPTREWMLVRGVPEILACPDAWVPAPSKGHGSAFAPRGQALALRCPGVVFCGTNLRNAGSIDPPLWRWDAAPGPATPRPGDALLLSQSRPRPTDGIHPSGDTKVVVWAFRAGRPGIPSPVGYHFTAGVFDDSDLGPGTEIIGWLPLGPRPSPAAAPRRHRP